MERGGIGRQVVRSRLLWLLAPALALVIAALVLAPIHLQQVREWVLLVAVFNALFCAAPAIIIAFLAARGYLASGSTALLLLGPGALVFGLTYLVGGLLVSHATWGITVHDQGLLLASALFLASGLSALLTGDLAGGTKDRATRLLAAYLGTLVLAASHRPSQRSPTSSRTCTSSVARARGRGRWRSLWPSRSSWRRRCASPIYTAKRRTASCCCCAAAFAVIGVSLAVLVVTRAAGVSPVVWMGRAGQWLGGVYLLVAVFSLADRRVLPLHRDLRELEERYRTLVELSPDPIIVDADGRYLFANPAAARLLGLSSPDELVGREITDFVAPEDAGLVSERRSTALQGRPASPQEIRLVRTDGTVVDVETWMGP